MTKSRKDLMVRPASRALTIWVGKGLVDSAHRSTVYLVRGRELNLISRSVSVK